MKAYGKDRQFTPRYFTRNGVSYCSRNGTLKWQRHKSWKSRARQQGKDECKIALGSESF